MKKTLLIGIPVLMVVGVVIFLKAKGFSKKQSQGPATVKVTRGTIVEKALAVGKIEPEHEVSVKSKVSGIVEHLYADVGDRVRKGQPLIDIKPEPTPLEFAESKRNLELAEVELEVAGKDLDRARELKEKGLMAQEAYDKVEQRYKEALLRKRLAQERLALLESGKIKIADRNIETVIRAPIDGYVLERLVNVGDPVVPLTSYQAGTELMKLADMENLIFRGTVDEIDVGKLREGMPVQIKIGALSDVNIEGKLLKISPKSRKVENATVFDVEIAVFHRPGVTLRSGYSANADIILKKKQDVLMIPERVVEFRNDSTFVRVPGPVEGESVEKAIETGLSDGINIEVVSGLAEGEEVLEKPEKEIE
ncbi:MAG: efflux RND transporter periplasmic adaptor subunit [Candidatus Latescibacterota bacterium]|nr:MAG: efflux RND transporter periplasmic adaptor subunit [Candidatus Latescibacterota bacterium]